MTTKNRTTKTHVTKIGRDTFKTAEGTIVSYSAILANHTAYDVDGIPSETLAKRAKLAKARKSSRKSSTSRTTPRNTSDLSLIGETSATRQANQRGKATAELVSRVNGSEGASPLSFTSSPAPISAKIAPDSEITAPDSSLTLGEVTTEDEWPIVSTSFDDDDFASDSLGDLWYAQQVQQAQAIGAAMQLAIVESREIAGDSDETVADSTTPILSEWKPLFDWSDYTQTATDQFGNSYTKSANLITVTLANGQQGGGQTAEEALNCALTTPFYTQAELAQFGEMAEANGQAPTAPCSFDGLTRNEIIYHSYLRGLIADRTELARLAPIAPLYEYKLNVFSNEGSVIGTVMPKIGMSVLWGARSTRCTITAITAWGVTVWRTAWQDAITVYPENLSDLWVTEDMASPDSIKPIEQSKIEWTFDCQGFGSGLFFQAFVGSDGYGEWYKIISERGELIKPRTPGSMCDFPAPYSGELTLGDFVEADEPVASPYPPTPQDHLIGYREDGHYILQMPADHPLTTFLESWLTLQHALPILAAGGYDVAALKNTLTLPRPKTVKKAIDFTIATLKKAQEHGRFADEANQALGESAEKAEAEWETRYLGGVITHMEGLL